MRLEKDDHEAFATFFSKPSREGFRDLIRRSVGETDYLDFKAAWPDMPKLAKHVLSLANSGGGAIVIGVSQEDSGGFAASGVSVLLDKTDVVLGLKTFVPRAVKYFVLDFVYESSEYAHIAGKAFQVLLVEDNPKGLPFLALADGPSVRRNALYVRAGASSREADHEDVQRVINRRIETGHSNQGALDLDRSFAQLRALDELRHDNDSWLGRIAREIDPADDRESSDFKNFIELAYQRKKAQVWTELGLGPWVADDLDGPEWRS
jgi:hypothetical protein